ncbi:MAG: lipoyl domain-containing protein [Candidatus Tectimicrobiota bacterium]
MKIVDITVPHWGLEMEEATVIGWLKQIGDRVEEGEPILAMETDKAEGELEAEVSGRLVETLASPGDVVKPGDMLGRIEVDD